MLPGVSDVACGRVDAHDLGRAGVAAIAALSAPVPHPTSSQRRPPSRSSHARKPSATCRLHRPQEDVLGAAVRTRLDQFCHRSARAPWCVGVHPGFGSGVRPCRPAAGRRVGSLGCPRSVVWATSSIPIAMAVVDLVHPVDDGQPQTGGRHAAQRPASRPSSAFTGRRRRSRPFGRCCGWSLWV